MLRQWQRDGVVSGDCDDAAVLAGALTNAIGFQPQAVVAGFRRPGAAYQHVYTVVPLDPFGSEWIDFDVTRPADLPPQTPTRTMNWQLGGASLWDTRHRPSRLVA